MLRLEIIDDDSGRGVQSYADGIEADVEAEVARINSELALECERTLRNRSLTLWPIRTGFSRDRWRGEDVAGRDYIELVNTADYAATRERHRHLSEGPPQPELSGCSTHTREVVGSDPDQSHRPSGQEPTRPAEQLMALADLRMRIRSFYDGSAARQAKEDIGELGTEAVEAEKTASGAFGRMAQSAAAIGAALLSSFSDALEAAEQRLNELEQRLGRTSPEEKALQASLIRQGFSTVDAGIATGVARQLGFEGADATDIANDAASLERAGFNSRFIPELARAFEISNAQVLSNQLNAAFDVATKAGNVEELLTEVFDNPQVYQAFGTVPQAVEFITQQPYIPAETTIQLEQGGLIPTASSVTADVEALSTISPSLRERAAGRRATSGRFFGAGYGAAEGAIGAIPFAGDLLSGGFESAYAESLRLDEALGLSPGDRTLPARPATFDAGPQRSARPPRRHRGSSRAAPTGS